MQKIFAVLAPLFWCVLLLAGFMFYGSTGHDDSHINFWFAHTLLEYGQMVNYNGARVEQTTSVLLVLLTVLFRWLLPFGLVTSGYLVDIVSALCCCILITSLAKRFCPALAGWPALIMLGSTSFMLWTFGGMGSVLAALVLLSAVAVWWLYVESPQPGVWHRVALVLVTLALVLVRPEMPLVIVVCSLLLFFVHAADSQRRSRFLQIFLASFLGSVILFIWQKIYFASWLPMPVLAKQSDQGGFFSRLDHGSVYLLIASLINPVVIFSLLSAPVALFFLYKRWRSMVAGGSAQPSLTPLLLLLTFMGVYCGFIWTAGGDWMQGGRFLVPIIPLAALYFVLLLNSLLRPVVVRCLLLLLFLVSFWWVPMLLARESRGIPFWVKYRLDPGHEHYSVFEQYNQEHLRDMEVIDHLREIIPPLYKQLGRPVRLLSGQAGMVFYTLGQTLYGQVEFSDFRGLVEGSYTLCPSVTGVNRNAMGIGWDYKKYFEMMPTLQTDCHIALPDVVYELHSTYSNIESVFEQAGYTLIHQEQGFVVLNETSWVANTIYANNLVFVRNDLMPLLGNPEKKMVRYSQVPLRQRTDFLH